MKINEIQKYIALYDIENHLFKVVGPRAKDRGFLLFDEFYQICMWKSPRPKRKYIKNKEMVEEISKRAFAEKNEKQKMEILSGELDGVGIPTASAILAIVYPESYPVIDIRCLEMLKQKDCDLGTYPSLSTWLGYLETMRKIAEENDVTPRQLDMTFFAMHRELQEDRNLYKTR